LKTALRQRLLRALVTNGCLARDLQVQLSPGTSANGTADYADGILATANKSLLVGMEREAQDLLAKADQWMTAALTRAAAGEEIELEYRYHFDLSVCRWLLGPPAPPHDLTRGVELLRMSGMMAKANFGGDADHLDRALAMLVYAGRYEECVAKFEGERAKAPRTKQERHDQVMRDYDAGDLPADEAAFLLEDRFEAPMAYLTARERLTPTLPEGELARRYEAFLRQRVPNWLDKARRDLFTMWIRITTHAEAGASARAAVREIADRYA
jgi:hypothetical protein